MVTTDRLGVCPTVDMQSFAANPAGIVCVEGALGSGPQAVEEVVRYALGG